MNEKIFHGTTYRIEDVYGSIKHMDSFVRQFFQDLGLKCSSIISSGTRFEYDNSDFTGWVLYYGKEMYKIIQTDKQKLLSIEHKEKSIFNVSGNGYGTGLLVTLNLAIKFDK